MLLLSLKLKVLILEVHQEFNKDLKVVYKEMDLMHSEKPEVAEEDQKLWPMRDLAKQDNLCKQILEKFKDQL